MKTRIIVGVALTLVLAATLYFGGYVMLIVLSLFSFAAVYEIGRAFMARGYRPIVAPAYAFSLAYAFVYYYFGVLWMFTLYILCLMTTAILAVLSNVSEQNDALPSLFILCYPTVFLICMLLVYFWFDREISLTAACLAYAAPECADTFAYFGGTLFGKHKLCPSISPKKTIEGSAFALLGGLALGALLIPLQKLWGGTTHVVVLLLMGLACGALSQLGDLFASRLKRWAGIKDFSTVFPGHGGIMDRLDSILFCAPTVLCVFLLLLRYA